MINEFLTRLRFLLSRVRGGDLDAELQFHIEQSVQTKIAEGITPEEARRRALIEFGGFSARASNVTSSALDGGRGQCFRICAMGCAVFGAIPCLRLRSSQPLAWASG